MMPPPPDDVKASRRRADNEGSPKGLHYERGLHRDDRVHAETADLFTC